MLLHGRARLFVLSLLVMSGCGRGAEVVADAGVIAQEPDAAAGDAGDASSSVDDAAQCNPALLTDGGLISGPGVAASVAPPQNAGWVAVSSDAECTAIQPGALSAQLSWTGPAATTVGTKTFPPGCDPAIVDGKGNLAVFSLSGPVTGNSFVRGDGTGARFFADGNTNELQVAVAPRASGFVLLPQIYKPWCEFAELLDQDAIPTPAILLESLHAAHIWALVPNPHGGYVEARELVGRPTQQEYSLQLRWVDDSLQALGDWHTAMTWPLGTENLWRVAVDQQGKALMLSFVFPPSLGSPQPPSMWTFSARWMDATGALTEPFQPIAPTYTSSNSRVYFAEWGAIRPLRDGGFAMFHAPAPQGIGGTISPSGWYAFYPSGQAGTTQAPAWLQSYDGSLQLLAGGTAYAALRHDPDTCARTILLLAPSGATCFTLALEGSNLCGFTDTISPDGTLLLQFGCLIRWWPGLARIVQ